MYHTAHLHAILRVVYLIITCRICQPAAHCPTCSTLSPFGRTLSVRLGFARIGSSNRGTSEAHVGRYAPLPPSGSKPGGCLSACFPSRITRPGSRRRFMRHCACMETLVLAPSQHATNSLHLYACGLPRPYVTWTVRRCPLEPCRFCGIDRSVLAKNVREWQRIPSRAEKICMPIQAAEKMAPNHQRLYGHPEIVR